MKIFISILILTIVFLLNVTELNAAENQRSSTGSSRQHGVVRRRVGRPRGSESRREDGSVKGKFRIKPYYREPVAITSPLWGFCEHMGQKIGIWLDDSRRRVIKADYKGNHCPSMGDYQTKNFLVRLATLREGLKIVEYINQDKTLMGVRAPIPTTANVMEPYSTQWFIIYFRKCFRVRINPETKEPVRITLASKNEDEVVEGQRAEEVNIAGFKFVVVRGGPHFDITGAELPTQPVPPTVVHNVRDLIS